MRGALAQQNRLTAVLSGTWFWMPCAHHQATFHGGLASFC
jgi:hypothetical protein